MIALIDQQNLIICHRNAGKGDKDVGLLIEDVVV
jgi:hypothetical protein